MADWADNDSDDVCGFASRNTKIRSSSEIGTIFRVMKGIIVSRPYKQNTQTHECIAIRSSRHWSTNVNDVRYTCMC